MHVQYAHCFPKPVLVIFDVKPMSSFVGIMELIRSVSRNLRGVAGIYFHMNYRVWQTQM